MPTKVAVIQKPPVLLDRDKTIAQAVGSIDEAASAGAALLVFPEAYIRAAITQRNSCVNEI